ncbi:MAG: hypothetical protein J6C37_10790 [Roseburia sp.]|nr:hypothetical protein [Roseburia sp.]
MNTIKVEKKQVQMVAHRGVSGLERENTNAAFVAAGNRSYFGVETDVHKTADGKYVIIHDETTKRVTNGAVDINVEENSYDKVKDIILPDLDGSTSRQDIRIPLLTDYVKICKKYDKKCVLELKNHFDRPDIMEIIDIIKNENYLESVIFISFDLENCITLRDLLPSQPVQWLTASDDLTEIKNTLYKYHLDLDIYYERLNQEFVAELHANNVKVNCWTCDDKQAAEKLIDMGVDYITSNILE